MIKSVPDLKTVEKVKNNAKKDHKSSNYTIATSFQNDLESEQKYGIVRQDPLTSQS